MTFQIAIFLAILSVAFFLFAKEIFSIEISALLVLVLLVLSGIVTKQEAFSSFSSDAIFLIGSLFVMTAGLNKTGVIRKLERALLKIAGRNRSLSYFTILVSVGLISAFVSNTATLAVVIPVVTSLARGLGESPRRWLLPVALASVLGGMTTLVGTSTNIIISGMLPEYNLPQFDLFTPLSISYPIFIFGMGYLFFIAPALLKGSSTTKLSVESGTEFNLRAYTAEFVVLKGSPLVGKRIENCLISSSVDVTILGVVRDKEGILAPRAGMIIASEDHLILEGNIERLNEIKSQFGLEFLGEAKGAIFLQEFGRLQDGTTQTPLKFYEVLVTNRSALVGRTSVEIFLRNRFGLSLLAVNRHGHTSYQRLKDFRFNVGDILVVQFVRAIDNRTLEHLGLVPLQELERESYRTRLAPLATIAFISAIVLGSISSFPLSFSCLIGALVIITSGVLRGNEIYDAIDWRVLIFIGSILCLGKGMEQSGTAELVANLLSTSLDGMAPFVLVLVFLVITAVMTQVLSNQATAVVLIPVAIRLSHEAGINPFLLVMAVTLGASFCFLTPLEPVFMMVHGPGKYRLLDFVRTGALLWLAAILLALYMIIGIW